MATPCASCGFLPASGMKFCPHCGARITAGVPMMGMTPQQPPQYAYQQGFPPPAAQMQPSMFPMTPPPPQWEGNGAAPAASPPSSKQKLKVDVPPAATGDEAASIYKRMLAAVRGANSYNDDVVSAFKRDCKAYGQGEIKAKVFYERLSLYFGGIMMLEHMLPQLARLIPDDKLRKKLVKYHAKQKANGANGSGQLTRPNSMSTLPGANGDAFAGSNRRPASTSDIQSAAAPMTASERFSSATAKLRVGGYGDNPSCSICSAEFDHLKKRRHRCRKCGASVCSLCSPARMLIPPEQVASDAKNYDPSHPQRVCTICAPLLQSFQDGLNTQYANCHKENPHESKSRLHLPYSKSLEQECRNAADIIGNFFRADFGANSDRSIPVAFLKRAHGLAFLTVIKAGLLISAKVGTGVVIAKLPDGSWSAPSAIGTAGISGGFEAGGEIVEFMIVLGSTGAVKVFHRTQVSIGGGLSVAVGPYGRDASAQAAAGRGGINANYSYSHSRGLFVGVSLEGAVVTCRSDVNSNFYGRQFTPEEILSGTAPRPRAAQCLYDAIENAMAGVAQHDASSAQARAQKDWCMHCQCRSFASKPFSKKCKTCGHQHDK
ncbi:hypothetical protein Poli38472_010570 [Pythium oligandrum]|uniref:FYVE-type domain-containing protein n=1 Tax=Pythium oligandrum TaxID=41045 RepID=A0A8K1C3H9_PYTOL|nr:hypothetical protein Poli38472_010570 [Pythium oligandrum]|eukprot:TMW55688.1 hypothetical protein Poli38472_010570 [Pythium oligandrum]